MKGAPIWKDQRGLVLPMVLAVMILVFMLVTAAVSQAVSHRQAASGEWEMIQAQYAAESGIARMQQKLRSDPGWSGTLVTRINGMKASTTIVKKRSRMIQIRSVAKGKRVRQTVTVELDSQTLQIEKWTRP
ncbi:hypothetical protein GXN76_10440 [Kroppenstedtia pulmonis]|uniref:Uncharacterized protein n=1 Tax=Kroppenstedtia pulmonis TaxID=1380685 RepID=A0A7D3Y5E8_9BACL|nr:pilus assembly PilX N-terminal domain-containing protein [Kroppenstedtia pulmonis]QKG84845.1 hypothetical protein GXN76_10440 [Kroppenstedtia pulmonis]